MLCMLASSQQTQDIKNRSMTLGISHAFILMVSQHVNVPQTPPHRLLLLHTSLTSVTCELLASCLVSLLHNRGRVG